MSGVDVKFYRPRQSFKETLKARIYAKRIYRSAMTERKNMHGMNYLSELERGYPVNFGADSGRHSYFRNSHI